MSDSIWRGAFGRCTLTATRSPFGSSARWTWPIEVDQLPRNRAGYEAAGELVRTEMVRLWRLAAEAAAAGLPPELPDGTPRNQAVSD